MKFRQSISDQDTGVGTETVIVEIEMLEGNMGLKEGDQGSDQVETESVVVQMYGVKVGQVDNGGQESRESFGDLT